ncbi:MAG TPA: SUMF1/EgtB/PvdO family nonheme iron enzyme [Planctomycetota bacterium]|nr:SUMF1/EgtB/PvdO family nonheme iron enzyme [Planctomycetota bacterium]
MRAHLVVTALCVVGAALPAQKPKDLGKLAETLKTAEAAFDAAQTATRRRYEELEQATNAARGEAGAAWIAELGRVLEPVVGPLSKELGAKKGATRVAAAAAYFKKDGGVALGRLETPALKALTPYLLTRLQTVAAETEGAQANWEPKAVAERTLAELLAPVPFHEVWNTALSQALPEADQYRKAVGAAAEAKWDLDVAKDPVLAYQRGAPEGFARVPAGAYYRNASEGFAKTSPQPRKQVTLAADVFIAVRETTHAEYHAWWRTLEPAVKPTHLPTDPDRRVPLWSIPEGAREPAPSDEQKNTPIVGIELGSAVAYATARGARLPTETEWCAAAGGPQGLRYPWGPEYRPESANDREHGAGKLLDVGSLPAGRGPFGHLDLAGNAEEWTMTYESGRDVDPQKIDATQNVIVRGGSMLIGKEDVSTHWVWRRRAAHDLTVVTGFRLAMDAAAAKKR